MEQLMAKFEVHQLAVLPSGRIGEVVSTAGDFFTLDLGSHRGTYHASELAKPTPEAVAEYDAKQIEARLRGAQEAESDD